MNCNLIFLDKIIIIFFYEIFRSNWNVPKTYGGSVYFNVDCKKKQKANQTHLLRGVYIKQSANCFQLAPFLI